MINMAQKRDTNVIFREAKDLVITIDNAAAELGTCRSAFIREAIREKLRSEADSTK
jgi:metal-responsive CopG/Arc/MetJ family transcriptional regulator